MDNLFAGIWPSPDEKGPSTVSYPAPDVLMGRSGSLPGWQLCRGISGSFRVEWVAGFVWNQWQPWSGIRMLGPGRFVEPILAPDPEGQHHGAFSGYPDVKRLCLLRGKLETQEVVGVVDIAGWKGRRSPVWNVRTNSPPAITWKVTSSSCE